MIEIRLFVFKTISLITGFTANLITTKILLENYGIHIYATFATITAIPMLLPFADMGLGQLVYNHFILEKDKYERKVLYARVFFATTTVTIVLGLLLIFAYVFFTVFWKKQNSYWEIILLIIFITFASVPFALTYRIFQAENKMHIVVPIQSIIPVSICLSLMTISHFKASYTRFILLIPSISYFLITFATFYFSQSYKLISKQKFRFFNLTRNELSTGWLSIGCLVSSILLLQIPRIILTNHSQFSVVAGYSLVLLILLPVTSIISVMISPSATEIIENDSKLYRLSIFWRFIKKLILALITLTLGILSIPLIAPHFQILFMNYEVTIAALVLWISSIPWQIAFYITTTGVFLIRQFKILTSTLLVEIIILQLIHPENISELIYLILVPMNIFLSILSLLNLKMFLNRDEKALNAPVKPTEI